MSPNSDRYASDVLAIYQRHHCHVNMCHHRSLEKTNNVKPTGVACVWQLHSLVFYTPEQDDNTYGHAIAAVVVVVVVAVDATIIVASQCRVIAENVLGLTSI